MEWYNELEKEKIYKVKAHSVLREDLSMEDSDIGKQWKILKMVVDSDISRNVSISIVYLWKGRNKLIPVLEKLNYMRKWRSEIAPRKRGQSNVRYLQSTKW